MADYVYLYFFGLICHVGTHDDEKKYAAMVRDMDHTPTVLLYEDGERKNYELDRADTDSIKFEIDPVLSAGNARTSVDFLRFVPSLKELMGGRLRLNIHDFAIQVFYPRAKDEELTVVDLYEHKGLYLRTGGDIRRGPDCVARLIGLRVPAKTLQVVAVVDGRPSPVGKPVAADGCVVIANLPKDNNHVRGHVMKFGHILLEHDSLITVIESKKCQLKPADCQAKCDWVCKWLNEGPAPTDLECGNTNWP